MTVPVAPPGQYARVLNGLNFWQSIDAMRPLFVHDNLGLFEDESISVIGSGGSAATIVAFLAEHSSVPINVISRQPTLFSRGESYFEVRALSDPSDWTQLPMETRKSLIQRIDRSVVSAQNMRIINHARNVIHYRIAVSQIDMTPVGNDYFPSIEGELNSSTRALAR
jgi:cation diffusion facilitator CzcD-associated flavoprotein CzcO